MRMAGQSSQPVGKRGNARWQPGRPPGLVDTRAPYQIRLIQESIEGVRGTGGPPGCSAPRTRPIPVPSARKGDKTMATILTVSASPSAFSKTASTRRLVDERLTALGHTVETLDARDLPAAALLAADTRDPAVAAAIEAFG